MLVEKLEVGPQSLFIKFQKLIMASSLETGDFVVLDEDNNPVADALQPIDKTKDYTSLNRSLYLHFSDGIQSWTNYKLRVHGLSNIQGQTYAPEVITFSTKEVSVSIDIPDPGYYIEDHSLIPDLFDAGDFVIPPPESATPSDDDTFTVIDGSHVNGSIYNLPTDDTYSINLVFSHDLNPSNIEDFIQVQKRKLSYLYTQWEDVDFDLITVSADELSFTIPDDGENYKYRILVKRGVSALGDPDLSLTEDYEINFSSVLTPFYSNPDEIVHFYDDITELEAAEQIHKFSLEVQSILGLSDHQDPPFVAVEYVTAAVLCHFGKLSGDILSANGNADDVTLGDFRVSKKVGGTGASRAKATRESATNWCELAAAIKRELKAKNRLPRHFVRSGNHKNPIPSRYFKKFPDYRNRNSPYDYGLLNDN